MGSTEKELSDALLREIYEAVFPIFQKYPADEVQKLFQLSPAELVIRLRDSDLKPDSLS